MNQRKFSQRKSSQGKFSNLLCEQEWKEDKQRCMYKCRDEKEDGTFQKYKVVQHSWNTWCMSGAKVEVGLTHRPYYWLLKFIYCNSGRDGFDLLISPIFPNSVLCFCIYRKLVDRRLLERFFFKSRHDVCKNTCLYGSNTIYAYTRMITYVHK